VFVGSGSLFKYRNKFFFITASHCVNEHCYKYTTGHKTYFKVETDSYYYMIAEDDNTLKNKHIKLNNLIFLGSPRVDKDTLIMIDLAVFEIDYHEEMQLEPSRNILTELTDLNEMTFVTDYRPFFDRRIKKPIVVIGNPTYDAKSEPASYKYFQKGYGLDTIKYGKYRFCTLGTLKLVIHEFYISHNALTAEGNSGSPIFCAEGLVGIHCESFEDTINNETGNRGVHAREIQFILDDYCDGIKLGNITIEEIKNAPLGHSK